MATKAPSWATEEAAPAWATETAAPTAAPAWASAPAADPRMEKIKTYAAETDRLVGLTPGTSLAQLEQESRFRDDAVSPTGALGVAQVIKKTRAAIESRVGRPLNPKNTDDALLIHREVMMENMKKFGNRDDALRAYNGGWDKSAWSRPETAKYVSDVNSKMGREPVEGSPFPAGGSGTASSPAYKPFAQVRQNIDPKTLNTDPTWLAGAALLYELWERKPATNVAPTDLAEWGKDRLGYFNFNTVDMARIANQVRQGTQEQKEAFLWMMDTYDNTNISWEGAGRAAKGIFTDPLNLVGLGTFGVGFGAKMAARTAAKEAAKQVVKRSMLEVTKDAVVTGAARTGIVAGMEGAIYGGAQSAIKQGVEVSAGRRDEISTGKLAVDTALGAGAGLLGGTALDVVASKALPPAARAVNNIREMFKGKAKEAPKARVEPTMNPVTPEAAPVVDPAVTPQTPAAAPSTVSSQVVPEGTLTPDEIRAATARQQDGRLPADEVAPDMSGAGPDPLIKLPEVENTGGRTTRVNGEDVAKVTKADVEEMSQPIIDQLKTLSKDDLTIAVEQFRTGAFTDEMKRVIASAMRLFAGDLKAEAAELVVTRDSLLGKLQKGTITPEETQKLDGITTKIDELLDRSAHPIMGDDSFGTMAGTMLSDRKNGGAGTVKITVADIMAEKGVTRDEALTIWAEVIAKAEQDSAVQKVADAYEVKIQAAMEAGDTEAAAKLAVQKRREMAGMVEEMAPGSAGAVDKLKELATSNVFSPTTVQVNLFASSVKTFIIPVLKLVFGNAAEKSARAEVVASYSAMKSSFGSALRSAATAYRLEQALLTRDGTRLVEGELAIKGWLAGKIRFFPRILAASDEFLSRITYDSYVAGKAASEAAIEGAEKGLKGKDLDAFIKDASQAALESSRNVANGDDLVQPIINKGLNLKLSGDELWDFVEKEAMRNPEALRKGTDEEALAYVRDVLYKRDFSGNGAASKLAQLYEKGAKAVPAWALVTGQLFFRTPIRVFEEGIRLTPGLQIIAPNFLADLAGKNGVNRQIKAQAESMTSLAVAGAVLAMYSQGRITGDGAYSDFKQQRNRVDGPQAPPYSIKMSDGSTWSYKLFDPISTPVKIMVNALERADRLKLKQSQGEDIPDSKIEEAFSHVSVGVAAVLTAIKDANLVSGARMTAEIFTNAEDIEKNEDKFLKLLGEKMFLLVPNTLHKIAKDHDPSIRDPRDFWQMVDDKLARSLGTEVSGVKTAMSYDILGNVRRPADTGSLWNIFSVSTVEERAKGMSPAEQTILAETDRLSRVMGATFKAPTTHKSMGDLDFRTLVSKDGKRTLYDVWQEKYKALLPVDDLAALITSEIPEGTFKYKEGKATVIQNFIGQIQEAAFRQLQEEEGEVINAEIDRVVRAKADARTGLFDSKRPY